MSQFDDRERAEERKFATHEELEFKAAARRDRAIGLWAAGLMGLDEESSKKYAASIVIEDLKEAGDDDVLRKIFNDLQQAKIEVTEHAVRREMDRLLAQAREELST